MSITSRIKAAFDGLVTRNNPLENPAVSVASPAAWSWLSNGDPTASGEVINELTALQLTAVYSCVRIIAESVASLPLQLWRKDGKSKVEATDSPLYNLLTVSQNIEMSRFSFWETFVGSLALTGNAYAQIERNSSGQPIALWPLNPRQTFAVRLPNGDLAFKTTDGEQAGKFRIIKSADMLHCPLYAFDGIQGISPVHNARQMLGLARAAEKYGARFFGNGGRPGGILQTEAELDQNQQAAIRDSWQAAQGGGGTNQGKTAILHGKWTYESIGLAPEESQFLGTQQFSREQIASLFRVPVHMLGDTTKLSNNVATQQNLIFVTDCLRSYMARIEAELHRKLLTGDTNLFVCFDVRERLRGDFQQTMQGLALGRQWGWLSINDCKAEMGENPIGPEGDVYLAPLNMVNAKALLNPAADPAQEPVEPAPAPDTALRSIYFGLFRDATGRLAKRSTRDANTVRQIFEPLLASIAELGAGKDTTGYLQGLTQRAVLWSKEDVDSVAEQEFTAAIKELAA